MQIMNSKLQRLIEISIKYYPYTINQNPEWKLNQQDSIVKITLFNSPMVWVAERVVFF